jgi:hypothetical protein
MAATNPQRLAQVCTKGSHYTRLHEVLTTRCIPIRVTFGSYSPRDLFPIVHALVDNNQHQHINVALMMHTHRQLCGDTSLSFRYFLKHVHEMASNHAGLLGGGGIGGVQ